MEYPVGDVTGGREPTRAERAFVVLGAARTQLERGWSQDAWHVVVRDGRRYRTGRFWLDVDRAARVGSCLIGALLIAGWDYSDRDEDSAPAVDALWHELQDRRGLGWHEPFDRVCAPAVRALRVQDLIRWNDERGRTRADVLGLVDGALTRIAAASAAG